MPDALHIRRHRYQQAHSTPQHHHAYWHCDHVAAGDGWLRCAPGRGGQPGHEHRIQPGDWWLLPPGCPHSWRYASGSSVLSLRFALAAAGQLPARLQGKALLLAGVLPELVAGREWRDPTRAGAVIACLQAILALQDGAASQAGPTLSGEPGMANRIKELVKRSAGRPVRVSGLAARLGTSPRALRRIFRTETGMRLKDWIDDERARRIETLLAQGLSVAEIASRLGFSQPSDCGRLFRRVRGISPLQWRVRDHRAHRAFSQPES